ETFRVLLRFSGSLCKTVASVSSVSSSYCVGLSNCRNVSVFTSRNIGVPGGSCEGIRKSSSNRYCRWPHWYTVLQHLNAPVAWRLVNKLTIEPRYRIHTVLPT